MYDYISTFCSKGTKSISLSSFKLSMQQSHIATPKQMLSAQSFYVYFMTVYQEVYLWTLSDSIHKVGMQHAKLLTPMNAKCKCKCKSNKCICIRTYEKRSKHQNHRTQPHPPTDHLAVVIANPANACPFEGAALSAAETGVLDLVGTLLRLCAICALTKCPAASALQRLSSPANTLAATIRAS